MLSICIPAYTYVDYTAEAVRSILQQDVDVEVVVVEDFDFLPPGHDQRTRIDAVRDLLASDARIRWISANTRRPIQQNWNFTVAQATRSHVKVMGADDRLRPEGLKSLLSFLKAEPDTQFLGHLGVVIDDGGQIVRRLGPYVSTREVVYLQPEDAVRLKLRQVARFREPVCNVFAKSAWAAIDGYSEKFRFCFDVHFNIRLMSSVPSVLVSEEWCELRRHQGSDGANLSAELALGELEQLVQVALDLIKPAATLQDRQYAQALIAYRVVELAVARANGSLSRAVNFMWENRERIPFSIGVATKLLHTLYRRAKHGDVQNTVANPAALQKLEA